MEPCLGKNLYETLRDVGRLPEKTVIEWTRQILNAVEYMHKNGVLHRNIKLENILLHEVTLKFI
jgi:serine/threonine protein kinase KIN1/2